MEEDKVRIAEMQQREITEASVTKALEDAARCMLYNHCHVMVMHYYLVSAYIT